MKKQHFLIKASPSDNVGIVPDAEGLQQGAMLENGIVAREHIPMGHKAALEAIEEGGRIVRYGQTIGYAKKIFRQENGSMSQISPCRRRPNCGR